MTTDQQRLVDRVWQLILKGEEAQRAADAANADRENDNSASALYTEWLMASHSFLQNLLGPQNLFTNSLQTINSDYRIGYLAAGELAKGLGILRAVKSEIEFGPIARAEALISAEIFEDFLEMAQHLLDQKYVQVVPSLVGAVLEDGLRRIARQNGVTVNQVDSIAGLNTRLFDAKIYNALARKKVEVWNAVRNNADHGNFDVFTEQDAKQMLEGVREFLALQIK